ncbi:MAG: N-acetylmuramoyl-L-alanine amidase [Anaerolineae bacterium]|nr:N-acetylmuramoyl-L-alanine amidase [Gemmatimonadaceae bacterium]
MIVAVLLAAQIAAAHPAVITIRGQSGEQKVAVAEKLSGPAIRLSALSPVIPVSIDSLGGGRYRVTLAGIEFFVADQAPFMEIGDRVLPLATAPFLDNGDLFLPLQVLVEQLPRAASNRLRYDMAKAELLVFAAPSAGPTAALAVPSRSRPASSAASRKRTTTHTGKRRVVVDAGHGGPDNGMSGPLRGEGFRVHEKHITLAVAKRLASILQSRGVDVVMTRTTDTLIALSDRGRIANQRNGDVFVSIHVNAANLRWPRPEAARGFETYFLAEAKTEDARRVERMENESVKFETGVTADKDDPLSFIMNDMAQNEHLRESSELASMIQASLGDMHPGPDRGVKQAGFRVLVTAFMPAVLVEIGFGTNVDEARFLTQPQRQQEIATAVAAATMKYLEHYERRVGLAGR